MASYLVVTVYGRGALLKVGSLKDGILAVFLADGQYGLLALALALFGRRILEQKQLLTLLRIFPLEIGRASCRERV